MFALIDADYMAYSVGFACENETDQNKVFSSVQKLMDSWIACPRDFTITNYKIFAGGGECFRHNIATTQPYKGNRVGAPIPRWRDPIREFLYSMDECEQAIGVEADDLIAMWSTYNKDVPHCIISLDKDLDQLPSYRISPEMRKKRGSSPHQEYEVTEHEAMYNFYSQMLTGDDADHILGLKGRWGPRWKGNKKKALQGLQSQPDIKSMCEFVCNHYKMRYRGDWDNYALEQGRLLWMLRSWDELENMWDWRWFV